MTAVLEWKATLLGLFIAAIIVAALFLRPTWGVGELAQLAAALGAVLLGTFARIGGSVEPAPPEKPKDGVK